MSTLVHDSPQLLAPIIAEDNTFRPLAGNVLSIYCSSCKRARSKNKFPRGRRTCSNCLEKARKRALSARAAHLKFEIRPGKDTKYCSSCKRNLAHVYFSSRRKTCRMCLFVRRLRRNAHLCSCEIRDGLSRHIAAELSDV